MFGAEGSQYQTFKYDDFFSPGGGTSGFEHHFNFNFDDIFNDMFGDNDGFFREFKHSEHRSHANRARGK